MADCVIRKIRLAVVTVAAVVTVTSVVVTQVTVAGEKVRGGEIVVMITAVGDGGGGEYVHERAVKTE